ncbi:MAG: hypothetical protein ACXQS2_05390 [Methermicoccaceae archaeon]
MSIRDVVREIFSNYGVSSMSSDEVEEGGDAPIEVTELILLTEPTCPACHALKQKIFYALQEGWITEMDASKGKGKEIADKLGIMTIPTLVAKTAKGDYIKCKYGFEGDDFVFDLDIEDVKKKE